VAGLVSTHHQPERKEALDLQAVADRVRGEFNEMPGLRLTREQAARLWGLDAQACDQVLDRLVAASFLRWSSGAVVRRP
jgi:hypothetical protein